MLNLDLKIALIRQFGSQIEASKRLKINESKLSHLVRGHRIPNEQERAVLKQHLGADYFRFESEGPRAA